LPEKEVPKDDLTGECSIPCIRMESITSKSPRGSGTLDELNGIPRPARMDVQDRIMRKAASVNKQPGECAPPLAKDGILIKFCDSFASTICITITIIPFSSPFGSRGSALTLTPPTRTTPRRLTDILIVDEHDAVLI
jgi:hypothetical protein